VLQFTGLDQDAGDPSAKSGRREPLGVLHGPDARLDADPGPDQGLHDLHRARLGEVDRRVVGGTPGPHELQTAPKIGLDPGAGRHADGYPARLADLLDDLVDDLRIQPFASLEIAWV
jgi:hypothetical protein